MVTVFRELKVQLYTYILFVLQEEEYNLQSFVPSEFFKQVSL